MTTPATAIGIQRRQLGNELRKLRWSRGGVDISVYGQGAVRLSTCADMVCRGWRLALRNGRLPDLLDLRVKWQGYPGRHGRRS
jgi:hypothetical protein